MELKDLAPWIAIAFTLALSILVPLFTQISNNKHKEKQQKEFYKQILKEKRADTYLEFLGNAGSCIAHADAAQLNAAGSSIQKLIPYVSNETRKLLFELFNVIREYKWDRASELLEDITEKTAEGFKLED